MGAAVAHLPEPPREDPFETIERFRRTPATFSCLGMGCRTTLLLIVALLLAAYVLSGRPGP